MTVVGSIDKLEECKAEIDGQKDCPNTSQKSRTTEQE